MLRWRTMMMTCRVVHYLAGRCLAGCLGLALLALPAIAGDHASFDKVSFYFAAHEDDWQLFMNPSAFEDVTAPGAKAVFIHVTAGDAGLGAGTGGKKSPYYLARERGAVTAIRFMADSVGGPREESAGVRPFHGHPVYRARYGNTVAYFLRLPDGHPSGKGFPGTGHQSLQRLAGGEVRTLAAVDGSTVYHGWADLVATIRAILDQERGEAAAVALNVAEPDATRNPGDHSDHRMTAKAALMAAQGLACARRLYYVDYASARLPENLDPKQRDIESAVLAVTAAGILERGYPSIWTDYFRSYLGRNYFRVEEGTGRCDQPAAHRLQAASRPGVKSKANGD